MRTESVLNNVFSFSNITKGMISYVNVIQNFCLFLVNRGFIWDSACKADKVGLLRLYKGDVEVFCDCNQCHISIISTPSYAMNLVEDYHKEDSQFATSVGYLCFSGSLNI